MDVTLHRRFDLLAAPSSQPARDLATSGSHRVASAAGTVPPPSLPAVDGGSAAAVLIHRAFSAVARLAAPVSAPSTRDRRLIVGARAVLLKGRAGSDVASLAASERSRAALRRVQHQIAADRDAWTSHVGAAPHNGARGEHP